MNYEDDEDRGSLFDQHLEENKRTGYDCFGINFFATASEWNIVYQELMKSQSWLDYTALDKMLELPPRLMSAELLVHCREHARLFRQLSAELLQLIRKLLGTDRA